LRTRPALGWRTWTCLKKRSEKLRKLKPASAPGPDGIGSMLLKQMADQVAKPLSLIFRKVMDSGEVPMDWRGANVTPIFKKGCKADPSKYQPVSL
jgi:hypothetical protein